MKRVLASTLTCAALAVSACSASGSSTTTESSDKSVSIVTAFYPLQWASQQVAGDKGNVSVLTSPGSEAHDLELSPQQIASLSKADLVVYLEGFQPAVDEAIKSSGAKALNVADVVKLSPAESHSHDDEGDHADHDHGDLDPHFWQDPTMMKSVVNALEEKLASIDPDNASAYASAAATASAELDTLDKEFSTGLNSCVRREFITTHTAFHYLASRYNLEEIGISGITPNAEPSPARIAEVQAEAKKHSVTTIFFETLTSDAVAKSLANDLGLKTAVLDPLEGVTDKSPGTDYPSIMRANLKALSAANECS